MRDYFKRVGIGMLYLTGIFGVGALWLGLPAYVLINYCQEFNWIAVGTLAWMVICPVLIFSAMDDGDSSGYSVRYIPPKPPPPPKTTPKPQHKGRMGQ